MKNKIKNRRVIIIKKLPASYIEEAIVILRDNEEKSIEKELINSVKDKNIVENRIKEEDLNILKFYYNVKFFYFS